MKKTGKQSIMFDKPPVILQAAAIAGNMESQGPLRDDFDKVVTDTMWGEESWEKAESKFLRETASLALFKAKLLPEQIDYMFGGDLMNQCAGVNYGLRDLKIPFIGLYGACSTMALSMSMSAMVIDGGYADNALAITSSHFCSAEKQFRFPLEYGGQRPPSAQWTVTAAGCAIVSGDGEGPKIDCITTGKIVDMGITDINNMGAAMAPAAADTLITHFKDTNRQPDYYDLIVSGDLGYIGLNIVKDLVKEGGYNIDKNYNDCGLMIFDRLKQDVHAGGSGCGCSAATFCGHIYKMLREKKYNKVLFMSTGALMNPTTVLQGESIPSVAHAVSIIS